jgi:2-iminobutanoate/2-iminopropanoate deaminase
MADSSSPPARGWTPVVLGPEVPSAAGAYSPGVRAADFFFVSGQIPKDPRTGEIVGTDVETQTRQVLQNLSAVLAAGGATLADVVSVTAYLADPDDWGRFNDVYRELMPPPYPSRTALGAALRGIRIELSAIAYLGGRGARV